MERLTTRREDGAVIVRTREYSLFHMEVVDIEHANNKYHIRLAEYEETGLTPERIITLKSVAIQARMLYEICADLPIDYPSADRFVWTMGELKDALIAAGY